VAEADQRGSSGFFGWTNVALLFFIYGAVYGFIFYGFTVIFPEMIRAQAWSRGDAAVAHTLRAFSLGAFAPLVAIAIGKAGARRTMIAGLLFGVVVLGCLGTVTSQLWHWIVLWGILMPAAFSFGGAIPIQTTLTHWFSVRRATVMGIVLSSAAFAGFIAAPLYTVIMRETGTWKTGWLAAGGFCALALVASLFIKNKPADLGQHPDGIDPESVSDTPGSGTARKARTYRTSETWELREVLRAPALYLVGVCMLSQLSAVYLLTTHGVLHLTDLGFTPMQAGSAIGSLILFSGFGRLPSGFIGDRIEPRWIMTIALAGMGVAMIGIWKAPENLGALLAIVAVFGLCFGSLVPMAPAIIGNYFGPSAYAPITGFMTPFMILLGAPVPMLAGIIYDRSHSYDIAFAYVVVLTLVAALLTTALVPPKKAEPREARDAVETGVRSKIE
jgi:sugar phosphate permease